MAEWKKVIVSGSNAELAKLTATSVTASLSGNVVGDLTGTASWANTASWALNSPASISSSYAVSASYALSASNADDSALLEGSNKAFYRDATNINAGTIGNAFLPSAINVTSVTASLLGNVVGDLTGTASWATNAVNSSGSVSSSYAEFASIAGALATSNTFSITGGGISATGITFNGTSSVALNASIDANAVTTAKILDANVTTDKIADGNVTTAKILDANVTEAKINSGAVTVDKIGSLAVTDVKIATSAVTTDKIAAANVTNAKLANSSLTVGSTNIALGASATTLAGLTSVTSTTFVGALTGTATTASYVAASSAGQGQVTVTGNVIDLGLETTDSVTFANLDVAGSGSYSGALVVQGNLTVNGTASFINTQELLVEDKFVTFASGSTTATDGGFIVSQASGNVGQAFAFQSGTGRWGVASGVAYNATSITPEAYTSLVAVDSGSAAYSKPGNIFVDGAGDFFMYS